MPEHLARLGVCVDVSALAVGDYVVAAGVLVERKTVRGLHVAVAEGSFWAQLGRLRRACGRPYLLVEGSNIDHGPLPQNGIRGVCLAVMEQGIFVIRSTSSYDSALWLARLAARSTMIRGRARRPVWDQVGAAKPERAPEAILSAVPGISTITARSLLRHFGSVAAVAAASEDDLLSVLGVGPVRARTIGDALHRASSP